MAADDNGVKQVIAKTRIGIAPSRLASAFNTLYYYELGHAGRDLHLHIDRHSLNALKRYSGNTGDHGLFPQTLRQI